MLNQDKQSKTRYFNENVDEPKDLCHRIGGYDNDEPLLSLEESSKPLIDIVPHSRS